MLERLPAAYQFGLLRQLHCAYRDLQPPRCFRAVQAVLTKCMAQLTNAPRLINRADEFALHLLAHAKAEMLLHDRAPPGLQWLLDARYCVRVGPSRVRLYLPRRPGVAIEICSDSDPGYSTGEQNFCGSKQQFAARLTGERHCVAYRELEQRLQLGRTWCLAWQGHDCCGETGAIERKAVFCPNFFQAMGELLSEEADALYGASDGADATWLLRSLGMKLDSDAFQGCYEPDFGALCYSDPFVCRAFASEPAESWDDEGREESPPEAQIAPRQWPKEEEEEENLQRDGRLESRYLTIRQRPWAPKQDAVEGLDGLVTVPDAAETIVDGQLVELLACSVELARHEPPQWDRFCRHFWQHYPAVRTLAAYTRAELRRARARIFAAPLRNQICAFYSQLPQLKTSMQDLSRRLTLLDVNGELPPSGYEMTQVKVSVQHAAGTAYFLLMMGREYDEDSDFGRSRKFQTVLWVDFEDAKMNSHHELYRQRSHVERAPYLQHELVRGPAYCNPASDETRLRALAALGFPSGVSPGVLLDACRGTMWLPFLSVHTHRANQDTPLEWWEWVR